MRIPNPLDFFRPKTPDAGPAIPESKEELMRELNVVTSSSVSDARNERTEALAKKLLTFAQKAEPNEINGILINVVKGLPKDHPLHARAFAIAARDPHRQTMLGDLLVIDKNLSPENKLGESIAAFWLKNLESKLISTENKSVEAAHVRENAALNGRLRVFAERFLAVYPYVPDEARREKKKRALSPEEILISELTNVRPNEQNGETEAKGVELLAIAEAIAPGTKEERQAQRAVIQVDQVQRMTSYAINGMHKDSEALPRASSLVERDYLSAPTALGNLVALERKLSPEHPLQQEILAFWEGMLEGHLTTERDKNDLIFVIEHATRGGKLESRAREVYGTYYQSE